MESFVPFDEKMWGKGRAGGLMAIVRKPSSCHLQKSASDHRRIVIRYDQRHIGRISHNGTHVSSDSHNMLAMITIPVCKDTFNMSIKR